MTDKPKLAWDEIQVHYDDDDGPGKLTFSAELLNDGEPVDKVGGQLTLPTTGRDIEDVMVSARDFCRDVLAGEATALQAVSPEVQELVAQYNAPAEPAEPLPEHLMRQVVRGGDGNDYVPTVAWDENGVRVRMWARAAPGQVPKPEPIGSVDG